MPAVAQIMIEVDDSGAVTAFKAIGDAGAKIGPSIQSAQPALTNLSKGTNDARESAALLSEEFGVNMPRALRNILATTPGVSKALSAAFTGFAVAGFIELVKSAVDQLTGFSEQLDMLKKQNDALTESVAAANKTLIGPQNLAQVNKQILQTTNYIGQLNQALGLTGDAIGDSLTRGMTKFNPAAAELVDTLDKQKTLLNDLYGEQAKLIDEEKRTDPIAVLQQQNAAREAGLVGIQAINQAETDQVRLIKANVAANVTTETVGQAQITAAHAKGAADRKAYMQQEYDATRQAAFAAIDSGLQGEALLEAQFTQTTDVLKTELDRRLIDQENYNERVRSASLTLFNDQIKLARQQSDEIASANSEAAVAMVPPWERSYAQIQADTQTRLRQIQQELDDTKITSTQAAQLAADAWQVNFARTRDQLASDMENFFDEITSGNIGQAFKKMFEDLVFQMVATWILGMNSMRSAASTGFGGGPTGILGALFGLGGSGSGGVGGTPPFLGDLSGGIPTAGVGDLAGLGLLSGLGGFSGSGAFGGDVGELPTSIPGLGLSAGLGVTAGGVLPSGSATGGLAGILSKIFPNGASIGGLNISGAGLAALGIPLAINGIQRGGILGALEGAGGGALTGFAIGGPIGAGIGAIIGALASLIGGLFGPHTGDTARIQVMEPFLASVKQITDSYDVFQTDYNTGISELETLRTNSLAALKKIGGKQVKGNSAAVNSDTDAAEKHLTDTEAQRAARSQIAFGPPQFETGGYVHPGLAQTPSAAWRAGSMHFSTGGEVPAILHAGEYVLNSAATRRIGLGALAAMNSGSGAGGGTLIINAIDSKSFDRYLQDPNNFKAIAKNWQRHARAGLRF